MTTLALWQNYYVIVGSSAGALIGLQFVVLSLISDRITGGPNLEAGHAYATPTIVHFGAALGLSALLCAPWESIFVAALLWGIAGLIGVVYIVIVTRRMRKQAAYRPEFEDWLFHVILPLVAYLTLTAAAYAALYRPRESLFGVAASALLLLFVGIHNAWDTVTYHLFAKGRQS